MTCLEIDAILAPKLLAKADALAALTVAQNAKIVADQAVMLAMTEAGTEAANVATAQTVLATIEAEIQTWQTFKTMEGCT